MKTAHRPTRKYRSRQQASAPTGRSNPSGQNGNTARQRQPPNEDDSQQPSREAHRRTLLALRERVRGNLRRIADTTFNAGSENSHIPRDTVDLASDNVEQDVTAELLGSSTNALQQIDTALKRIEAGTYGHCEDCQRAIPAARLEALPYTSLCVHCAARDERRRNAGDARSSVTSDSEMFRRYKAAADDVLL
jgi:DnaK suppressor protein